MQLPVKLLQLVVAEVFSFFEKVKDSGWLGKDFEIIAHSA
jgi:hypothetical protein